MYEERARQLGLGRRDVHREEEASLSRFGYGGDREENHIPTSRFMVSLVKLEASHSFALEL